MSINTHVKDTPDQWRTRKYLSMIMNNWYLHGIKCWNTSPFGATDLNFVLNKAHNYVCGNIWYCSLVELTGKLVMILLWYDDVIQWKHFTRYWPWCGESTGHRWIPRTKASDAELCCFLRFTWINGWVNNREAVDLRRHHAQFDVTVMSLVNLSCVRLSWIWLCSGGNMYWWMAVSINKAWNPVRNHYD